MASAKYITNWSQVKLVLNLNEIAYVLGVTLVTARKLCRDGEIPAVKLGGEWRIEKNRLIDYLNGNYTPPSKIYPIERSTDEARKNITGTGA